MRITAINTEKAENRLRFKAARYNEEDYAAYEPLYDGLDLKQTGAQFHYFNFIMRRSILVFLALFWRKTPWF